LVLRRKTRCVVVNVESVGESGCVKLSPKSGDLCTQGSSILVDGTIAEVVVAKTKRRCGFEEVTMSAIFRGRLCMTSNSEDDELLGLTVTDAAGNISETAILAKALQDEMEDGQAIVSVRYLVSDEPIPEDKIEEAVVRHFYGPSDIKYSIHYSEITGYLWTDENLIVGGHDLLEELKSYIGKYLHLEFKVAK
jgi:hypothetical protein